MYAGGMFMNYANYNFVHEAILYETISKHEEQGVKHPFYIKSLVPLETDVGHTINIDRSNLANLDLSWLSTYTLRSENTLDLIIPYYLIQDYPDPDIIPKGTKFLVCFVGGNINKCQIIGRCQY